MKDKRDNKLVKCISPDGTIHYFTSATKAANFANVNVTSVSYSIVNMTKPNGYEFIMVDGSNIMWKDINNL